MCVCVCVCVFCLKLCNFPKSKFNIQVKRKLTRTMTKNKEKKEKWPIHGQIVPHSKTCLNAEAGVGSQMPFRETVAKSGEIVHKKTFELFF